MLSRWNVHADLYITVIGPGKLFKSHINAEIWRYYGCFIMVYDLAAYLAAYVIFVGHVAHVLYVPLVLWVSCIATL